MSFEGILESIELISFDQELLSNNLNEFRSYRPEIKNIAFNQYLIKNKIIKFIEQLIQISNKTLHIPPTINRTIGAAQLAIQKSIALIEQTKTRKVEGENKIALDAINEDVVIKKILSDKKLILIFISHKLSKTDYFDKIYMVDEKNLKLNNNH